MRARVLAVMLVAMSLGCTAAGGPDSGLDAGSTRRRDAGVTGFTVIVLDADAGVGDWGRTPDAGADGGVAGYREETPYFAMAVDPDTERVGVAYYVPSATQTVPGTADYALKYLEYQHSTGAISAVQQIRVVQRKVGLSLQFNPATHEPMVAYLGGGRGFAVGESISWFQSDAVINQRTNGTSWVEQVVARNSNDVPCGNGTSDRGFLVGLWPSIVFDAQGNLVFAYRDCHNGQFPQQDWNASDVEVWDGAPTNLTGHCASAGGDNKEGWGGHVQLALGAKGPAMIFDQMIGTSDTNGKNVVFQRRGDDGVWQQHSFVITVGDTQTGASLAYDSVEGYGVAVIDRQFDKLWYLNSADGTGWNEKDAVFGSGSGGWYPSLAMDPVFHEPAIAFYVCSNAAHKNETSCSTTDDELVVSQRIGGNWVPVTVDTTGGIMPKLGFFASGKRFVVYRTPPAIEQSTGSLISGVGALKIAVERD